MPDAIDPAWEYWTPDPEIAEVMAGPELDGFESLGDESRRFGETGPTPGFRFGRRDPDKFHARMAPPRPEPDPRPARPAPITRPDAPQWDHHQFVCATCGASFVGHEFRKYCRRSCSYVGRSLAGTFDPAADAARLARLWATGMRTETLADVLGITTQTFNRWRKSFGLPPRTPGNFKRYTPVVELAVAVGTEVVLAVPENPRLHGTRAVVAELTDWGAHLDAPAAATGKFRALWAEMALPADPPNGEPPPRRRPAPPGGVSDGTMCWKCGGFRMVRDGPCLKCLDCGEMSGGCG